MFGMIFTVVVSIGFPLLLFFYAYRQKKMLPFLLGSAAFLLSQVFFRMPLLQYLSEQYPAYTMMSMTEPILFGLVLGLSAGLFEETARFILMVFLMKQRDFQSGLLFGAGHGGIEAVLIVGIPVATLLFSSTVEISTGMAFIGGIERFFAIVLHIGLSIIVLQAVVQKRFRYVVFAIIIHGLVDALIVIIPLFVRQEFVLFVLEGTFAFIASMLLIYSLWIKRKGIL